MRSARNVLAALDREKYEPALIGISQTGRWQLVDSDYLAKNNIVADDRPAIAFLSGEHGKLIGEGSDLPVIDVALPILHGPYGEDGTTQGILKSAGVPYVGAGVLGSAIGMDKVVMKQVLRANDLPVGDFIVLSAGENPDYQTVVEQVGNPFFIKPANLGSSVGISKVHNQEEYEQSVRTARQYDEKLIVEAMIVGRELECAVLGNDDAKASSVGEIVPKKEEFYSYSAKYLNEDGAALVIPAELNQETVAEIQRLAVATFHALAGAGLARVDFFLREDGTPIINEINTLPGFTSISMYPKLWEQAGIAYSDLIDQLIELARQRFQKEQALLTTYKS